MKKITFCIVAILSATLSMAQEHRGGQERTAFYDRMEFNPENMAAWQTGRLQQALQLDSMQYQVIFLMNYADAVTMQDSIKARRERAAKMRAEGKRPERPSEEQMKARMEIEKEREQIRNEQMKQILTAEQYEKRNWGAIHLHPLKARELIREGAEKALRRFKEDPDSFQPMKIEPPYTYCVTFRPDKDHPEPYVVHKESSDCLPAILR